MSTDFASLHEEIRLLLPWCANGSLGGEEEERVRQHVRTCLACRRDLADLEKLAALFEAVPERAVFCQAALDGLHRRIAREDGSACPPPAPLRTGPVARIAARLGSRPLLSQRRALGLAAGVLLALVLPLGYQLANAPPGPAYRTLASTSEAPAIDRNDLRVVFAKTLAHEPIRQRLLAVAGHIVAGPNPAGAYVVRIDAADSGGLAIALERLRRDPEVLLAEPMSTQAAALVQPHRQ